MTARTLYLVGGGDPTLRAGRRRGRAGVPAHGRPRRRWRRRPSRRSAAPAPSRSASTPPLVAGPVAGARLERRLLHRRRRRAPVAARGRRGRGTRDTRHARRSRGSPTRPLPPARRSPPRCGATASPSPTPAAAQPRRPSALGVASVSSAPVSALVQRMLTVSDNDLAEALGRAVAIDTTGQPANFAGAATAVTDALQSLGVDVTGLTLFDAQRAVALDRVQRRSAGRRSCSSPPAPAHPELRVVLAACRSRGSTGTLADALPPRPARSPAGVVRAKTGTLDGRQHPGRLRRRRRRSAAGLRLHDRPRRAAGPAPRPHWTGWSHALAGCGCR